MDDDQQAEKRRDGLLLKLLKTPPKPRPKRERGKGKQANNPSGSASARTAYAERRSPS